MNPISRRKFLQNVAWSMLVGGACVAAPLHLTWAAETRAKELLLLCDTPKVIYNKGRGASLTISEPGSVNVLEVASGQSFKVNIPFFGHALVQNPARPYEIVTFEKWGRRAALIDLREKALITKIEMFDEDFMFFGHAAYVSNASAVVNSEDGYSHNEGRLVFRDPVTLQPLQKISSYGLKPHECRALDDGRTIIVINQGKHENPPNISWIEVDSGKLVHQVVIDIGPETVLSHIDMSADGWICAVGFQQGSKNKFYSRLILVDPDGRVLSPKIPKDIASKMGGEVLSVAFLGTSGLVAATMPLANKVIVVKYKTQEAIGLIDSIREPRGILADIDAPDSTAMIVSGAKDRNLFNIKVPPGAAPTVNDEKTHFGGNGSHMTRIYV